MSMSDDEGEVSPTKTRRPAVIVSDGSDNDEQVAAESQVTATVTSSVPMPLTPSAPSKQSPDPSDDVSFFYHLASHLLRQSCSYQNNYTFILLPNQMFSSITKRLYLYPDKGRE